MGIFGAGEEERRIDKVKEGMENVTGGCPGLIVCSDKQAPPPPGQEGEGPGFTVCPPSVNPSTPRQEGKEHRRALG